MTRNVVRLPGRPQQPESEPFRPFFASEMEGREAPQLEWLVDGVLLRGTVAIIAGSPGIGKSLLLQQLLTAVAVGGDFLGRDTMQCRAFGLFCEDPQAILEQRQMAILAHYDRDPADLNTDLSWQSRDDKDSLLVGFDRYSTTPKFTSLWHDLWGYCEEDGINLVGIDTAAAIYAGQDLREQVTPFMRALQRKAVAINGCVVLNIHPPKNNPNGVSGVTAWIASARSALSLGRPEDYDFETGQPANARVLRTIKNNYGVGFIGEALEYQDGVFVPSGPVTRKRKRAALTDTERQDLKYRLLIGCKRVLQNGGRIPADELDPKSMPARARRSSDPAINRVSLNDLYIAQQEMLDGGLLVRVDVDERVLVRPRDGPYYANERPYVPPPAPASANP
jgi:RecA-family ATPase